jgi:biopolymer transport protein TolR
MIARPSTAPSAEPNVTPMIDVLLVLLIVFMMAAIQVHRTVDVQLPPSCSRGCGDGSEIVLEILPGPRYRINQRSVPSRELLAELTRIYAGRPEKIISIAGDPSVRYDEVVAAMDVAKSAGVRILGIAPKQSYVSR